MKKCLMVLVVSIAAIQSYAQPGLVVKSAAVAGGMLATSVGVYEWHMSKTLENTLKSTGFIRGKHAVVWPEFFNEHDRGLLKLAALSAVSSVVLARLPLATGRAGLAVGAVLGLGWATVFSAKADQKLGQVSFTYRSW